MERKRRVPKRRKASEENEKALYQFLITIANKKENKEIIDFLRSLSARRRNELVRSLILIHVFQKDAGISDNEKKPIEKEEVKEEEGVVIGEGSGILKSIKRVVKHEEE